jgi:4-carboxymuconolactone decarboxylase
MTTPADNPAGAPAPDETVPAQAIPQAGPPAPTAAITAADRAAVARLLRGEAIPPHILRLIAGPMQGRFEIGGMMSTAQSSGAASRFGNRKAGPAPVLARLVDTAARLTQVIPPETQRRGSRMSDSPTFGRYAEIPYDKMTPDQQEGYRFMIESRGGLPGPSKIWIHNPKLAKVAGPFGAHFHAGRYSLTDREREIAVCVITSKWHSAYPTNAHEGRAKEVGVPMEKVEAILAGLQTSFDDEREQVVYEMAMVLSNARWVPKGLYDRAVKALGHVGITDTITLMGHYTSVAMTLAFYDVPAGATGMSR